MIFRRNLETKKKKGNQIIPWNTDSFFLIWEFSVTLESLTSPSKAYTSCKMQFKKNLYKLIKKRC